MTTYTEPHLFSTVKEMDTWLRAIHKNEPKWSRVGFEVMVSRFAAIDFYKEHFVAKRYLLERDARRKK